MKLFAVALATAFCAIDVANAATPTMRCDIYKSYSCAARGCFEATPPKAWAIIDWDAHDYSMCDTSSCQHMHFIDWPDGIYRSFTFPAADLMFKLNLTDMSAVETSTWQNASITSFANCGKDPASH